MVILYLMNCCAWTVVVMVAVEVVVVVVGCPGVAREQLSY